MNLEVKGFFRFFPIIILPGFLIAGLFGTIQAFKQDILFPKIFILFWLSGVVYNIYKFSNMVKQIQLVDNSTIIFKTILGKEYQLYANDVISIKVNNNMIDFKTNTGKFSSMGNYDGFSEFIVALKKINSNLITKGC
jgi:hypothetical protein